MKNKTYEFLKNGAIASIAFVGGGVAGGELSDLLTDDNSIITASSTISAYVLGYASFMVGHAKDNTQRYKVNNKWQVKEVLKDTGRLLLSLAVAEVAYIAGRSQFMNYFLNKNWDTSDASIISDCIMIPLYFGVAVPIAKKFNFIRYDKSD